MNNFIKRAITAVLFVVVLMAGINLHPLGFLSTFIIVTILGVLEFYRIIETSEIKPQKILGVVLSSVLVTASFAQVYYSFNLLYSLIVILLITVFIIELYRKQKNPILNIAYTFLPLLYIALPFALLNFIAFPFDNNVFDPSIVLGMFFIIWASDSGAYMFGMQFGKHRLFERISPKKSWEGSIGGGLTAMFVAYICSLYFTELSLIQWLILSVLIVVSGALGDLVESLFKRSLNIKDSGNILPGHGGILDRFDAVLFTVPIVFVFIQIIKEYFH